jgi:hypothetical protein
MELNWGGPGYATYEVLNKKSSQETHTFGSMQQLTQQLQGAYTTQFRHMQGLLNNVIVPGLTQMFQNPQGFGTAGLAAMKSQLQNTLASQYTSQLQGLQQQFASQNMAGLGSGVQEALQANMAQQTSGEFASGLENINIQNAMLQNQQQQFAAQGLMQADQLYGQMPQSAGLLMQGLQQQFNAADILNQQGTFLSNFAAGVLGGFGPVGQGLAGAIQPGSSPLLPGEGGMPSWGNYVGMSPETGNLVSSGESQIMGGFFAPGGIFGPTGGPALTQASNVGTAIAGM